MPFAIFLFRADIEHHGGVGVRLAQRIELLRLDVLKRRLFSSHAFLLGMEHGRVEDGEGKEENEQRFHNFSSISNQPRSFLRKSRAASSRASAGAPP